jgi:methyl-accepting chemotaxis protein
MKSTSVQRTFLITQVLMVLILVFLAIQGTILWRMSRAGTEAMRGLEAEGLPSSQALAELEQNLVRYRMASYELMFVQEKDRAAKVAEADGFQRLNQAAIERLKKTFSTGEGAKFVGTLEACLTDYIQTMGQLRARLEKDFQVAMQMLDKEVPAKVASLEQAVHGLDDHCDKFVATRTQMSVGAFGRIEQSTMVFGIVGTAFSLLATVLVSLNSVRIRRALMAVVNQLSQSSELVSSSSGFVASSSQSLAEGASEQAASLEETSSSLEEMSSRTRQNTESAEKAKHLAQETRTAADTGAADMQTMNTAMMAIKESSDDIAKIIKTIDEIAFQTNILALNAAVEAARAGSAGMGFAVVADEVRSLAQRCAQSARETSTKIEGAIARTAQGVQISAKVTQGLQEIVTKVRQVDELVAQVAIASREQSEGITQVNTAVGQMDKVVQGTAASAEESASASQELNSQADLLNEAVAELLELVGSSGSLAKAATGVKAQGKPAPLPGQASARPASQPAARSNAAVTVHTNANGHSLHVASNSKNSRAAAAIPMADDFKDF